MKISALDEKGKPVDRWFIYKVPQLSPGLNNDSATGEPHRYKLMNKIYKPAKKIRTPLIFLVRLEKLLTPLDLA